jgi:hypothetical protein
MNSLTLFENYSAPTVILFVLENLLLIMICAIKQFPVTFTLFKLFILHVFVGMGDGQCVYLLQRG